MAKKKKKATTLKKREMLLVGSKTQEALRKHDVNMAADALDGLKACVYWLVEQACKRAQANGRKTVRARDFMV